jgi:hypothetical protein
VVTGITWLIVHIPLKMAIAISAVGASFAIENINHSSEDGHHYSSFERGLYLIPLAVIMICLVIIGMCHKSLDLEKGINCRFNKWTRMISRVSVAVALIATQLIMDAAHNDDPMAVMGISAALFFYQAAFEEIAKLKSNQKEGE